MAIRNIRYKDDEILKKKLAGTLKNKADEINFVKSQRK